MKRDREAKSVRGRTAAADREERAREEGKASADVSVKERSE